jgi:bacillopeptidase F
MIAVIQLLMLLLLLGSPMALHAKGLERVAPTALDAFRANPAGRVSLLVRWEGTAALPLPRLGESRRDTRRRVVAVLRNRATLGAQVCARISRTCGRLRAQSLWIVNATALSADRQTLLALAHQQEVQAILAPPVLSRRRPRLTAVSELSLPLLTPLFAVAAPELPWNIQRVHAPETWEQGITGTGVVVASIDTGVEASHPALQNCYRGAVTRSDERNWFDAVLGRPAPYDDQGHGTETLSVVVGDGGAGNQIGVAPGAQWIAVKAFDANGGLDMVNALRAMQWLLAPTDQIGEHPDPDMAPDVVSSSWHNGPGDQTLRDAVRAWAAAGIVPVFSAGNGGAEGVGSPASYPEAIAVGAVDKDDLVVSYSGRGPSPIDRAIKPDVVAPGVDIRSASLNGGYNSANGTSLATPQAAGVVALMLQASPTLTPSMGAELLRLSADKLPATQRPNNDVGWGCVNALAAVHSVPGFDQRGHP